MKALLNISSDHKAEKIVSVSAIIALILGHLVMFAILSFGLSAKNEAIMSDHNELHTNDACVLECGS